MPQSAQIQGLAPERYRVPALTDAAGLGLRRVLLPPFRLLAPASVEAEKLVCLGVVALEQTGVCRDPGFAPIAADYAADRIGLWLEGWDMSADATPPTVDIELRGGAGASTTTLAAGTLASPAWNSTDLLAQVSGVPATFFEIWARVKYRAGGHDAAIEMSVVLDRIGGARTTITGPDFTVTP